MLVVVVVVHTGNGDITVKPCSPTQRSLAQTRNVAVSHNAPVSVHPAINIIVGSHQSPAMTPRLMP